MNNNNNTLQVPAEEHINQNANSSHRSRSISNAKMNVEEEK